MKRVLVTGATRGLGLAIARRLVSDGYYVIGLGRRVTPGFQSMLDDVPGQTAFVPYDLNDLDGIHRLVSNITRQHGPLYGLVNNAGVGLDGLLATMHGSQISRLLALNLEAPITLAKYASRSMLLRSEGRIVNISSIIASTGFRGLAVYGATKAGLEGFTRSLAREVARANITVNCVAPGYMETEMTAALEGEKLDSVRRRSPLGLPRVEDAAGAVAYLLSPDSERITGAVLTVDGGSTA